jgi:hypothetical protein
MKMEPNPEESGLSTREALRKLHSEIEGVLQQLKSSQKTRLASQVFVRCPLC